MIKVIELFDVKLSMLGSHQLQNVATTTCAFLCLRDQAYTKESAKALADTIQMTFPKAKLFLVVAMESDKDHLGFTRELLLGQKLLEEIQNMVKEFKNFVFQVYSFFNMCNHS
ncbi:hypothetical protein ACSBR2_023108 [Camellia fascicularis]